MLGRPMLRPRRPILGAAMVGGTAYMAGKSRAQAGAAPMAPVAPAPTAPAGGGDDIASKLTQLKSLLDQGVLAPEEFESAKQKLLAG